MNYMNKTIAEASSEELLHALIRANGVSIGPKETVYCQPVSESLIAIGPDATADIRIFTEDIELLNRIVAGQSELDFKLPEPFAELPEFNGAVCRE